MINVSDSFDLFPSREISFITDTEEIIGDDLSNFSLSTNNINLVKRKHSGGRKTGEIWNYFIKSKDLGRGLYEAECKACNDKWTRGRSKDMKIHLARNCEKVSDEIRTFWKEIILEEASNVRIQNRKQPQITKHFDSITSLPTAKTNELDQAILKAWVCCGFPFQTIENPFIIDLFQIAISGYNLPSRLTLSGKLLEQEILRIEKKIENELEKDNHLTISLDGWTSPRHDSIYNYIITTSTRKEYLIKLKSYNIEKQTGSFMAEEIQKKKTNKFFPLKHLRFKIFNNLLNEFQNLDLGVAQDPSIEIRPNNLIDRKHSKYSKKNSFFNICKGGLVLIELTSLAVQIKIKITIIAIPGYNLPSRLTLSGKLLEQETLRIEKKIENELEKDNHLTISLDGWTSPRHDSIYNYIITTSTRKEYLIKLKSYNIEKQTGSFMAEEIQKVMQNIGIEKFVAVVTDHGANLRVARRIIHETNSFILDLRCMAHAINLVASDFAEIESVKKIISNYGRGEIQSYCKTRWGTLYTTTNSITQSKPVFYWITENHPEVITNIKVYTLLQNEEFYSNCYQIASILKPVKELTNVLEARDANLADCFIGLIKLGAKINQISFGNPWKSIIISNYNRHLGEFINRSYILAYWLHPLYRGHSEESCLKLLMEMRLWKRNVAPYNLTYDTYRETPMKWWLSINIQENETDQLQELALLLFSIVSSQAVYKEIRFRDKNLSEHELRNNINESVITYDTFEKNGILERDENIEYERNENLEENTEIENELSTSLNINQFVDLTLPAFLTTGNNLFTNNRLNTNIRSRCYRRRFILLNKHLG
ncbi:hypothetical protein Glove_99g365 [Diversispora epigaea]|uniref:BED-type domain-containing protein n=1 Tax=Diversispora epigaea TaxID=1348612 RepID=A0A397JAZ3_9GLOM|nr:hypothetical protein Glove_99g365 [Diversispora epigaea]